MCLILHADSTEELCGQLSGISVTVLARVIEVHKSASNLDFDRLERPGERLCLTLTL